jgi:hypothetical protein
MGLNLIKERPSARLDLNSWQFTGRSLTDEEAEPGMRTELNMETCQYGGGQGEEG